MVRCGFLFDFIVVRIDVPNHTNEDQKLLAVDASFNNVSLRITSSRINVVEFKPRRSFEFDSSPADLKRDLSVCPLRLKVYYDSSIIGAATVPWNDCFLDRIKNDMGEITHIDECELLNDAEERVGTMEYICRLQCKCEEPSDDICPKRVTSEITKHINKIIDPNDILFVVAEPNKEDVCNVLTNDTCPNSCGSTKPTTALDLSPYRVLNGRLVQTTDAVDTCQNLDCRDLMKTSQQYQKLIDSLNPSSKNKCKGDRKCQAFEHCSDCPHQRKFSSHSDSSSSMSLACACFAAEHAKDDDICGPSKTPKVNVCRPPIPLTEETVLMFKSPRTCPVCNEDVRWLPKLAACPKCGCKPVPVYVEKPHNEEKTAEQILEEYLENRSSGSETDVPQKSCPRKPECRCTCAKGKICANCRVRKLCGDLFKQPPDEEVPCGKCEEETEEQFKLCTTSSKDCRPHLARVFSELKVLFDASPAKPETERINERCENELNPPTTSVRRRRISPPKNSEPGSPQPESPGLDACICGKSKKRTKRYRKKRGQGRGAPLASCRPPSCESPIPPREERLQKFHDTCVHRRKNVPGNMGWLWNANPELGPRWRPGAIRKPIKEIMTYFLRDYPADTIPISRYAYRRNQGKGDQRTEEEEEVLVQEPTLHICKKNGEIFITLRPLKNAEALKNCANPYLNMRPIQFKIVKNPLAAELKKMKQCLKDMGFNKCTCNKPVVECFCRSFLDKKRLEYHMRKECQKRGLDDFYKTLKLSDTEDSEVEYDFSVTPPAGLIRPQRLKKPDKVNVGTQYELCDWNLPPSNPQPPNTFMKWINCATGHKYAYRRASDLLTIGQKEALLCKQRKLEEAKKKGKKGAKGGKGSEGSNAGEMPKKSYIEKCPDGTKVNMRKYLDPKKKV